MEPKEVPDWLESEYQEIDDLIELLKMTKISLLSFRSSPVDVLTQLAVDLIIRLKKAYYDEAPMKGDPNPTIYFDERFSDPLGNIKQKEFTRYELRAWSPPMEKFLFHLAIFFSRSLKKDFKFQEDFHGLLKSLNEFLPPGSFSQKSNSAEKNKKNITNKKNNSNYWYYRRRSK